MQKLLINSVAVETKIFFNCHNIGETKYTEIVNCFHFWIKQLTYSMPSN